MLLVAAPLLMKNTIQILLIFLFTLPAFAQYPGVMDYSKLQSENTLSIENVKEEPIRCSVSIHSDKMWIEIGPEVYSSDIKLKGKIRFHDIKMFCKPIENITRLKPWRIKPYGQNFPAYKIVFI